MLVGSVVIRFLWISSVSSAVSRQMDGGSSISWFECSSSRRSDVIVPMSAGTYIWKVDGCMHLVHRSDVIVPMSAGTCMHIGRWWEMVGDGGRSSCR